MSKRILFICGSINQTRQMHQIAEHLTEFDVSFTPYYAQGPLDRLKDLGLLEFTILGRKLSDRCLAYLELHNLPIDYAGRSGSYDLVVTCSDLIIPHNIRGVATILVQEGMTDPETILFHIVRTLRLPRWLASTATTGLSRAYDYFCVASAGYREHFIRKGVDPRRIRVTGIPNFDHCSSFLDNDIPLKGYLLAATSDARETFRYENRRRFIEKCVRLARGRQIIFKLHPNERVDRATAEIERYAPGSIVVADGDVNALIANCDILVTAWSTVVYVGIVLGKEVYSNFDIGELRRLAPIQNGGRSAFAIADLCRRHLRGLPNPEYDHHMPATPRTIADTPLLWWRAGREGV